MGFTPAEVDAMSPQEFEWCLDGLAAVHGAKRDGGGPAPMSADRARELGIVGF